MFECMDAWDEPYRFVFIDKQNGRQIVRNDASVAINVTRAKWNIVQDIHVLVSMNLAKCSRRLGLIQKDVQLQVDVSLCR